MAETELTSKVVGDRIEGIGHAQIMGVCAGMVAKWTIVCTSRDEA